MSGSTAGEYVPYRRVVARALAEQIANRVVRSQFTFGASDTTPAELEVHFHHEAMVLELVTENLIYDQVQGRKVVGAAIGTADPMSCWIMLGRSVS